MGDALGLNGYRTITINMPIASRSCMDAQPTFIPCCVLAWVWPALLCTGFAVFHEYDYHDMIWFMTSRELRATIRFGSMCGLPLLPYLWCVMSKCYMYRAYRNDDEFSTQSIESNTGIAMYALVSGPDENSAGISEDPQLRREQRKIRNKFIKVIALIFVGHSITCLPFFIASACDLFRYTPQGGTTIWMILRFFRHSLSPVCFYSAMPS